jgi:hypothetical protein
MKKTFKIITVLLVTLSMLAALSGCDSLKKDSKAKTLLGFYVNEDDAEVIEFKKSDKVVLYAVDDEMKGEFEYDAEEEEGTITLDDEDYDFTVDGDEIELEGNVYVLEDDKDFDIDEFLEEFGDPTEEPTEEPTNEPTDEPTDEPTQKTDETGITLSGSEDKGWPKDDMANVPDPDAIVTYFSSNSDGCYVMIEGMTEDEATDYMQLLKNAGYTESAYETTSSDGIYYSAYDANEASVYFWYSLDGTASISYYISTAS